MTFNPLASPVDFIVLAGKRSPGIATLSGAALVRQIDERKGFGSIGATTIVRGQKLAKFQVRIRLFEPAHFEAWPEFSELVKRAPRMSDTGARTARVNPFAIQHPILEDLGIRAVVLEKLGQPEPTTEDGEWTYPIDFVEYRRRSPGLASASGEATGDAVDPVDQQIERLTRQLDRLAAAE